MCSYHFSFAGGTNLSSDIDEITRKMVELIEINLNTEGLYKRPGAAEKVTKLNKKLSKKKLTDIEKYKTDVLELCTCFKTYLSGQDPLVPKQVIEQILKYCGKSYPVHFYDN